MPLKNSFWNQNRKQIALSALVPVATIIALMALSNFGPKESWFQPAPVGIAGLLYLYIMAPALAVKFGIQIWASKKPIRATRFVIGSKSLEEEELSKILFNLALILFVGILVGSALPSGAANNPLSIVPFIMPYWAYHLYCLKTDSALGIFQVITQIKFADQAVSVRRKSILFSSSPHFKSDSWNGLNAQGKVAKGSPYFMYDR